MPTSEHLPDIPLSTFDPESVLAAESVIRDYCGWHIAPAISETLTLDGSGTYRMFLPTLRIKTITSIVDDGRTLLPTDFEWSEKLGIVEKSRMPWTGKRRGVVIVLVHGYDNCPASIVDMVKQLAKSGPAAITRASIGQTSISYGTATPSYEVLNKYRVPKAL
jgi:hypothetical protein